MTCSAYETDSEFDSPSSSKCSLESPDRLHFPSLQNPLKQSLFSVQALPSILNKRPSASKCLLESNECDFGSKMEIESNDEFDVSRFFPLYVGILLVSNIGDPIDLNIDLYTSIIEDW